MKGKSAETEAGSENRQPTLSASESPAAVLEPANTNFPAVFGVEKPEEIIGLATPNPKTQDFLRGLLSAVFELEVEDDRPEWARRALREMWRCFGITPKTKKAKSQTYLFGHLMGLGSQRAKSGELNDSPLLASISLPQLNVLVSTAIESEPPSAVADFHRGYADGVSRSESIEPEHNWPFYAVTGIAWREVSTARSLNELREWMIEQEVFPQGTAEKRVRKLCDRIGLHFRSKGGAPKKAKPSPRLRTRRV